MIDLNVAVSANIVSEYRKKKKWEIIFHVCQYHFLRKVSDIEQTTATSMNNPDMMERKRKKEIRWRRTNIIIMNDWNRH